MKIGEVAVFFVVRTWSSSRPWLKQSRGGQVIFVGRASGEVVLGHVEPSPLRRALICVEQIVAGAHNYFIETKPKN